MAVLPEEKATRRAVAALSFPPDAGDRQEWPIVEGEPMLRLRVRLAGELEECRRRNETAVALGETAVL